MKLSQSMLNALKICYKFWNEVKKFVFALFTAQNVACQNVSAENIKYEKNITKIRKIK